MTEIKTVTNTHSKVAKRISKKPRLIMQRFAVTNSDMQRTCMYTCKTQKIKYYTIQLKSRRQSRHLAEFFEVSIIQPTITLVS